MVLSALFLFVSAPLAARAGFGEAPPADQLHPSSDQLKQDITTVIDSQLAAFRADDYAKAYTFAASDIQGMFGLPEFEAMVKNGFPVIAHSASAEYGLAFDTGEEAVITVKVQNADKESAQYQYILKKEKGGWKINGVVALKAPGLSV
jgi:hypothetical protein